ncbi:YecA family protein [Carnobacterium alterfunditum]|uniref:YecA family protein n=1 Tax=Carnobacterium alterfunditum TaxID=28230 RepID=UPI0035938415
MTPLYTLILLELKTIVNTLDFLDIFAAKAEKISGINIELGTIVLSVDDLRIYQDFFESPFIFLNYLKNRSAATKVEQLKLNDELDHLGMYLFNNMYSKIFLEQEKDSTVQAYGYREELDEYFAGLQMKLPVEKPQRPLNKAIVKLLELLDKGTLKNKVTFSDFLLDFSSEEEEQFIDSIFKLYDKQNELGRRIPLFYSGKNLLVILCVRQEHVQEVSVESEHEYVDSILAFKKIDSAMWVNVEMNSDKKFISLEFEKRFLSNIPKEKLAHYKELGQKSFEIRKQKFLSVTGKRKIGRNNPCLCGSGIKYKRCCGR